MYIWDYKYCQGCKHLYFEEEYNEDGEVDNVMKLCDQFDSDMYNHDVCNGRDCVWRKLVYEY